MANFGLEKKKNASEWWQYGIGESQPCFEMGYDGLFKKAILEKKTIYTNKSFEISVDQIDKFLEFSKENDLHLVMESKNPNLVNYYLINEETSIEFTKNYRSENAMISFITTNEEFNKRFFDFHNKFGIIEEEPDFEPSPIFMIAESQDEVYIEEQGELYVPINRNLYSQKVLTQYDKCISDLKTNYPSGRISIFDGPPGSGKTFLIRALITEMGKECVFVVVPPSLVAKIGEPSFATALMRQKRVSGSKPIVLILEDADVLVSNRLRETMDAISSALNMGDGILGDMFNIRLVITTNQPVINIDPALMRPGRISSQVTVESLSKQEAIMAINSLIAEKVEDLPNDSYTLAQLFEYCRDNNFEIINKNERSFTKKKKNKGLDYY